MAAATGLVVVGWPAAAEGAPFDLAWSAPEGCPSREEIVDATYAKLGESRPDRAPHFFVRGVVDPIDGGFIVTLALTDSVGRSVGERVVRVDRPACAEIAAPTTVVLAMMIAVARPRASQGEELHERAGTPAEGAAPPDAAPPPVVRAPTAMLASSERPSSSRVLLGASGVTSLGVLPGVGLGVGLRASYLPGPMLFFGLEASFEAGRTLRAAGGEVRFQLLSAAARVGLSVMRTRRFELIPTLEARAGLIRTLPTDFAATLNETRVVPIVGPGVLVRAELTRSLSLEGLLDVECVLLRERFQVLEGDKLVRLHEPSTLGGRLSVGLAYEFR